LPQDNNVRASPKDDFAGSDGMTASDTKLAERCVKSYGNPWPAFEGTGGVADYRSPHTPHELTSARA
jgi:hypothetical protein